MILIRSSVKLKGKINFLNKKNSIHPYYQLSIVIHPIHLITGHQGQGHLFRVI